jgi:DNA-directed RNA polymerase subunit RPC12/RpoP
MPDINLKCKDCGADFVFTEGEQAFYKEKGFENQPTRCPECRRAKKAERNNSRGPRKFDKR